MNLLFLSQTLWRSYKNNTMYSIYHGHEKPGQPQLPAASIAIQFSKPMDASGQEPRKLGWKPQGNREPWSPKSRRAATSRYSYRVGGVAGLGTCTSLCPSPPINSFLGPGRKQITLHLIAYASILYIVCSMQLTLCFTQTPSPQSPTILLPFSCLSISR